MSLQTITQYYSKVDRIIQYGGSKKEMSIRNAFYHLLVEKESKNVTKQKEIFSKKEHPEPMFKHQSKLKVKLKANKPKGEIIIDENTILEGIPIEAWDYKIGNRSALEWVLDQFKEYKPSDPTIAEKFDTYKFSDYKEIVIDLIKKITTVSLETNNIINQMKNEKN